jgi:hypothetical protein
MKIHDSGLYYRNPVIRIDRQNPVHPLKLDDDAAFHGDCSAAQTRASSARDKGNSIFIGETYDPGNLFGGLRKNHDVGFVLEESQRVAFIDQELRFIVGNSRSAEDLSK